METPTDTAASSTNLNRPSSSTVPADSQTASRPNSTILADTSSHPKTGIYLVIVIVGFTILSPIIIFILDKIRFTRTPITVIGTLQVGFEADRPLSLTFVKSESGSFYYLVKNTDSLIQQEAQYLWKPTQIEGFLTNKKKSIVPHFGQALSDNETPGISVSAQELEVKSFSFATFPVDTSRNEKESMPIPTVQIGFRQYRNNYLRYGFNYPEALSLYECPDIHCLSIQELTLRVETLGSYEISTTDPISNLLNIDLFCNADGHGGSIECKNNKVVEITNSLGFKGFKIYRSKTITGSGAGIEAGKYQDEAFVFLFPEVIKGEGRLNYAAVLFAVDIPTESNLYGLQSIANSFFTF